jgi:hypothetical protein
MGAAEDEEQSGIIDSEDIIDEGNGDIEETELSEISGLNGEQGEGEPEIRPSSEETNLTTEIPVGVEEDRILQGQEKVAAESEIVSRADISKRKLSDQLTRHFQLNKEAGGKTRNMLHQIQKQLRQLDKIAASDTRQQIVIKQMSVQLKVIQKQVDNMNQRTRRYGRT